MIKIKLGKEIVTIENTAEPTEDLMVPSSIVDLRNDIAIPIPRRSRIKTEYNMSNLSLETTSNINPFDEVDQCTLVIDTDQKGYHSTGWISPLWFLAHKKTVCCLKKGDNILAQFELVFNSCSIGHFVDNPTMVAASLGNSIIWSVQRNTVSMDIIYTRNSKFEKYCQSESIRIQKMLLPPPKPKQPEPRQQPKPKPKIDEILPPHHCTCDIDYWDRLNSMTSEERSYYGWEHDPQ